MWDANTLAVAAGFSLSSRVHAVAMSPAATAHCLVAVGSGEPQVIVLCGNGGGVWGGWVGGGPAGTVLLMRIWEPWTGKEPPLGLLLGC